MPQNSNFSITNFAGKLVRRYIDDKVARSSAELAYYQLFALFPMLIFLNSVLSSLNLSVDNITTDLGIVLPPDVLQIIQEYLDYTNSLQSETLLYAGLFLTLYVLSRVINSITRSIMRAYRIVPSSGQFFRSILVSGILMAAIFLLFVLIIVSNGLLYTVSDYIELSSQFIALWGVLRYMLGPLVLFFALTAFYHSAAHQKYNIKQAMPGAATTLIILYFTTMIFSYYVANFSSYSVIYGSLGVIMVLMLWLYIVGVILIMGAHLNDVIFASKARKK